MNNNRADRLFWLAFPIAIGMLLLYSQTGNLLTEILAYGAIMAFALLMARKIVRGIPPRSLRLLILRVYLAIWAAIGSGLILYAIFRLGTMWYLVGLLAWLAVYLFARSFTKSIRRWAPPKGCKSG